MTIAAQVHAHFKVFAGKAGRGNPIAAVAKKAEEFVAREKVAPKSIGVEYLEASREVILTLGYRRDVKPYEITLVAIPLGKLTDTKKATLDVLAEDMGKAAARLSRVICHELIVTETGDFIMVVMSHR